MNKIRVNLITSVSSAGRGVGFYEHFLRLSLQKTDQVEFTSLNSDLIHYPFFDLFYPTLPWKKIRPTVVTIHDLSPIVLSSLYPKGIKGTLSLLHQRISLSNVAAIITDSHNSKVDIHRLFAIPESKIFVTPLAVDPLYQSPPSKTALKLVKEKYHLPDKFVLAVAGGPNPNKNLPLLAQATQDLNLPLVLVGGGLTQQLPRKIHPELKDLALLKTYDHLILPGFVDTQELNALYRLATLYCQPSLYEGFGLPLLEAMTAKCLVVSSSTSSLPEIYAPETLTFDPRSLTSLCTTLKQALTLSPSEYQKHISTNYTQAQAFTWAKTASLTAEVYRSVLSL